jgi:hypothetical protein
MVFQGIQDQLVLQDHQVPSEQVDHKVPRVHWGLAEQLVQQAVQGRQAVLDKKELWVLLE